MPKEEDEDIKIKDIKIKDLKIKDVKIKEYIEQMTPLQKIAYEISKKQLKSSFCIERSIGFIKYSN
jgi:hypothetical protein